MPTPLLFQPAFADVGCRSASGAARTTWQTPRREQWSLRPVTATSTSAVVIDITGTGKLRRLELSTREAGSAGR